MEKNTVPKQGDINLAEDNSQISDRKIAAENQEYRPVSSHSIKKSNLCNETKHIVMLKDTKNIVLEVYY